MGRGVQLEISAAASLFLRLPGRLLAAWPTQVYSQLEHLNQPDPAPIASEWVAVIKGAGLALSILALIASLRRLPEASI